MTRRFAVVNQKGGVGKTTSAMNLGAYLAAAGQRVLLVDLDPQANATSGFGLAGTARRCVYGVLLGSTTVAEVIVGTEHEGLDIIPSCNELTGAEVELVPEFARELRLQQALDKGDSEYDIVLIDCPPSLGLLTVNALTAAPDLLVPVQCEYLALEGLSQLMTTLDAVKRILNPDLKVYGLILTMFDARTNLSAQVVEEVRKHFPQAFDTVIPRSVRLSEAPSHGKSILSYEPNSKGGKAYAALAEELLDRVKGDARDAPSGAPTPIAAKRRSPITTGPAKTESRRRTS